MPIAEDARDAENGTTLALSWASTIWMCNGHRAAPLKPRENTIKHLLYKKEDKNCVPRVNLDWGKKKSNKMDAHLHCNV